MCNMSDFHFLGVNFFLPFFLQERFAEIFGNDAAAENRKLQEGFKKWMVAGMMLFTGVLVGSFIAQKRL